jgi:TonB family protein
MKNIRSFLVRVVALLSVMTLPIGGTLSAQQQPDPYRVYEVGNGVAAPKPLSTPNPEYTDKARKKKLNGTVLVAMIVTPDGKVRDPKVTKSLDKGLDKQALAAVRTWKFEPATKDGVPVSVHVKAEVDFRLYLGLHPGIECHSTSADGDSNRRTRDRTAVIAHFHTRGNLII